MQTGASNKNATPRASENWTTSSQTGGTRSGRSHGVADSLPETQHNPDSLPDFETLFAQMASVRMEAVVTQVGESVALDSEQSARQTRIAQETASARQAERNAHETRRADPSSIENGVVSSRHERLVTERHESAVESASGSQTTKRATTQAQIAAAGQEAAEASNQGSRGRATQQGVSGSSQPTEEAAVDQQDSPGRKQVVSSPATDRVAEAASQPAKTSAAVSAVGVSRLAGATASGRTFGGSVSPARAVAQLLVGRGGTASARTTSDGQVPADVRARPSGGRESRPTGARTAGDSRPGQASKADVPESVQRARFAQLVKSIRLNTGARSSSATIRLNPPELGRMRIDVRMVDHSLRVNVETSRLQTRELISSRAQELVSALRDQGINVERFEVSGTNVVLDQDGPALAGGQDPQARGQELKRGGSGERPQRRHERITESEPVEQGEPALAGALYAGSEARLDIRI